MSTALIATHRKNAALVTFAQALVQRGWKIIADPSTWEYLREAKVFTLRFDSVASSGFDTVLEDGLQVGLTLEDEPANHNLLGLQYIDLVVVDFAPLEGVLYREDVADRTPVFAENAKAWMIMAGLIGFRPIVTDLNDLGRVLSWIDHNNLGMNVRWLWAKATTALAIRMTELAKHVSYGTSPGGMLIGVGLPDPDSVEWAKACTRPHDALRV